MHLGIDLGCLSCKVSAPNSKKQATSYASLVAWADRVLVEREAAKELETRHHNIVRHLPAALQSHRDVVLQHAREGDKRLSIEACLAVLIQRILEKNEQQGTAASATIALHPALSAVEIERVKSAAAATGLKVQFVPSTAAVAVHYSRSRVPGEGSKKCLVVDAGCRFTSASVLNLVGDTVEVLATASMRKGGYDLDLLLLQGLNLADGHPVTMQLLAERAKHDLSSLQETAIPLPNGSVVPVTRDQFLKYIKPYLTRLEDMLREVTAAHQDVSVALLVGGTGRIPAVHDIVQGCGRGLQLELGRMDYEFSIVQGCVFADMETVFLPSAAATPFRYWTRGESGGSTRELLFDSDASAVLGKDAKVLYQELVFDRSGAPPSEEDFKSADSSAEEQPPAPPPQDGCLSGSSDCKVVAVYNVSEVPEGEMFRLRVDGVPQPQDVLPELRFAPPVLSSHSKIKELKAVLHEIELHTERLKHLAEVRNSLEEAMLRYEADDYPEKIDAKFPKLAVYAQKAEKWLENNSKGVALVDMQQLTQLINILMDDYEGVAEADEAVLGALKKSLQLHFLSAEEREELEKRQREEEEEEARKRRRKEEEERQEEDAIRLAAVAEAQLAKERQAAEETATNPLPPANQELDPESGASNTGTSSSSLVLKIVVISIPILLASAASYYFTR